MDKAESERIHARQRAEERYGISYNRDDKNNIVSMIKRNHVEAIFVERESNRVSVWYVRYKQQDIKVVYDSMRDEIVTFLPPDANERQQCAIKKVLGSRAKRKDDEK